MPKIKVRTLLKYSTEELFNSLRGQFELQLDDGVVVTHWKDVVLSRYAWEIFNEYPKVIIREKHLSSAYAKGGDVVSATTGSLLEAVVISVYNAYKDSVEEPVKLMDKLTKRAYEISNKIYNELSVELSQYVVTFDVLDTVEILNNPAIKAAKKSVPHTQEGIDTLYGVMAAEFKSPALRNNPAVAAIRRGVIKSGQANQFLGVRGFLTDIGSQIFPDPIMRGFAEGIRQIHHYAQESRSAAKALANSESPLQKAEYFSRQLQHIVMGGVQRLHRGDCGSTHYQEWLVKDRLILGGILQAECDLVDLEGMYYLDESSGQLRMVKASDRHLIGQTIKLRSALAGCLHDDLYGICSTCYGAGSDTVPENTNLGHYCSSLFMEQISQRVISTKHYDGSAAILGIHLDEQQKVFFWAPENSNEYFVRYGIMRGKKLKMIMQNNPTQGNHVKGLTDIERSNNVHALDVTRISMFNSILMDVVDEDGLITATEIHVELNGRLPSLSHAALLYIKKYGYTVDNSGRFVVDLSKWDPSKPLLSLPMRHYNMSDLRANIESFLAGDQLIKDDDQSLTDEEKAATRKRRTKAPMISMPVDQLLKALHDMISAQLRVPMSALQVILLAHLVSINGRDRKYHIPKGGQEATKAKLSTLYLNRSYGAMMAWEEHIYTLGTPAQYLVSAKERPDHPLDACLAPREVAAYSEAGGYKYRCAFSCCQNKTA